MLTVPEVAMVKGVIDIHTSNPPARETEFIPHSHPELEIGFFKSGRGIYTLKDCSYDIYLCRRAYVYYRHTLPAATRVGRFNRRRRT